MARRTFFANRQTALLLGYGGIILGSLALLGAYEKRGRGPPVISKLLPGAEWRWCRARGPAVYDEAPSGRVMALLPQSAPAAADWYVADYRETTMTTKGATGGECSASLDQVPPGEVWAIDRLTVRCTSTTPTSALCYDGL